MIKLELTNYQAIQLDNLLQTLSLLSSKTLPNLVKQQLMTGFRDNSDLKVVTEKLRTELDSLSQIQKEKIETWAVDEDLKLLDIKSPPDWNGYDEYLLNGGQLEYSEWQIQRLAALTQVSESILNQGRACGDAEP